MALVASIIGMFDAAAAMNPQQANAVGRCSYQQFQGWDASIHCTQKDTPFILPFP
jgi:hypothetical protein